MIELSASRRLARAASVAALCCCAPSIAAAADRWVPIEGEATVALPDPSPATAIAGATLACAEQKWVLGLRLAPQTLLLAGPTRATLSIGAQTFDLDGTIGPGAVDIPLPSLAIAPLKAGTGAVVKVGDDAAALEAAFSLRGSRLAIEAAEPLCTKRDMSDYETVALTPFSSYLVEAKELRKEEIELFRKATTAEPVVAAAKSVMPDGRSLLFVELCGSSWYYGASGCNITAFARAGDASSWKQVYDTEGADLYLDKAALSEGWPAILALPKKGGGEEVTWVWSGDGYAVSETSAVASVPGAGEGDGGD